MGIVKLSKIKHYVLYYYYEIEYQFTKRKAQKPHVLDFQHTIFLIKSKQLSICRFGDGEIRWILGRNENSFQDNSYEMAQRLTEILKSKDENILICIPNIFLKLDGFVNKSKRFWRIHLGKTRDVWMKYLQPEITYGDSLITRPYITRKNKIKAKKEFEEIKSLWDGKDLVIIEGEKTLMGVGNDLLDNSNSIRRVICPSTNAFAYYEEILNKALMFDSTVLFLLALGPTATILAYDLSRRGYRALDIGHIDIEYEWYLRKEKRRVPIQGKYVNETKEKYVQGEFLEYMNDNYRSSIIYKIG